MAYLHLGRVGGKGFCTGTSINWGTAAALLHGSHCVTRMSWSEISDQALKMPQCSWVPDSVAAVNSLCVPWHCLMNQWSFSLSLSLSLSLCVCVCGPVVSGASVFLHLHSVLAPSGVCDRSVPHSMAPLWFLAGWNAHRGLVHPQQVGNPHKMRVYLLTWDGIRVSRPSLTSYSKSHNSVCVSHI